MRRHDPAVFPAVRDDARLDAQRGAKLADRRRPQRLDAARPDDSLEIRARRRKNAVLGVELAVGEPETVVRAGIEPAVVVEFRTLAQDRRGGAKVVGQTVEQLDQVVRATVEDRVACLQRGVELAQVRHRRAVVVRRRRLGQQRIRAEIPGLLVELEIAARALQVGVDAGGAPHAAERIHELHGRAAHHLVHAALEGGLVVEPRRLVPVQPEKPQLVEQHRGNPGVLVDVEIDEVRRHIHDGRAHAGSRRRLGDLARRRRRRRGGARILLALAEIVAVHIVGVEAAPDLRLPDEITVEPDEQEQYDSDRPLDDPATGSIPVRHLDERPEDPGDHHADAPADGRKDALEERDDRVKHWRHPL